MNNMFHIVVWNGTVTHVYELADSTDKPAKRLEEEFDYKVEYYPQDEEQGNQP